MGEKRGSTPPPKPPAPCGCPCHRSPLDDGGCWWCAPHKDEKS